MADGFLGADGADSVMCDDAWIAEAWLARERLAQDPNDPSFYVGPGRRYEWVPGLGGEVALVRRPP